MSPESRNVPDTCWAPFATTHWSLILTARDPADQAVSPALSRLCQMYWPPLYAYLRRQGHPRADAQDLVQGFFARLVEHEILRRADRDKGRFRSFLLASLQNFVANVKRDERTARRGGGVLRLALDEPGVLERCEALVPEAADPVVAFDRAWAQAVLDEAASRLRAEYSARGRADLYEVLCRWLAVEPASGEYSAWAPRLGMTEGALAVSVFRLRQRFRELIREEVAHTVQTPDAIQDEVRYLMKVLASE